MRNNIPRYYEVFLQKKKKNPNFLDRYYNLYRSFEFNPQHVEFTNRGRQASPEWSEQGHGVIRFLVAV